MIPAANRGWRGAPSPALTAGHPAVRVMGALLLVATVLLADPIALGPLAVLVGGTLHLAGLAWRRLPRLLAAWAPLALLVVAAHTVSATDAAPLWHPSRDGLARGLLTVLRLATVLGVVAVAARALPLRDLTVGLRWWLGPLRVVGVDTRYLGLTLAVALGTAPRTQAEAARLLACLQLRRPPARRTPWRALMDRLLIVAPVMDGLARRAETLPLVLAGRAGGAPAPVDRPPWPQLGLLGAWCAGLVWLVVKGG